MLRRTKRWNTLCDSSRARTTGLACALALGTWLSGASSVQAYALQHTLGGETVRWHADSISLRIDPEAEAHFEAMQLRSLLSEAAAAWSGLEGVPELLISAGTPGSRGVGGGNGVYLVKDWTFQPNALATTLATYGTRTGKLVDADILINANYVFARLPDGPPTLGKVYDLPGVMTHEFGHVLGLSDSRDAREATMWPSFAPGETHQRDLDPDDQRGAESAYASVSVSELATSTGCGGASVVRRRPGSRPDCWIACAFAAVLLAAGLWLRGRLRAQCARGLVALGAVLLFGVPVERTPQAGALPVHAELPRERLPREHPLAKRGLAAFVEGAERVLAGEAVSTGAFSRDGVIWSRFRVHGPAGDAEVEIAGGSLNGLTQVVSGQAPPADGDTLIVVLRRRGANGWARLREGAAYGGTLGEGPAFEWPR